MSKALAKLIFNIISRTACSGAFWVSSLYHEIRYDPVKYSFVIKTRLRKLDEISGSYWCLVQEKLCLEDSCVSIKYRIPVFFHFITTLNTSGYYSHCN